MTVSSIVIKLGYDPGETFAKNVQFLILILLALSTKNKVLDTDVLLLKNCMPSISIS